MVVLAIPAGHLADRLPRRLVLAIALVLGAAIAVGLVVLSELPSAMTLRVMASQTAHAGLGTA
jgi:MFS family permease